MKLSIIICVYNTAIEYLDECLKSITCSTLQSLRGEYEICMVDDGSVLDYSALLEKYEINYLKTENRGILAARKTGIGMAEGTYIAFCDSDDTVSFHYHAPMVAHAEETGAEIVINDWAFHTPGMRYYCKHDDLIRYDVDVCGDDKLPLFFKNCGAQHSFYVLWNKLYKAELLRTAIKHLEQSGFPTDCSYSEDAVINFFAWRDAERINNIHTGFYFYRIHDTQSVKVSSEEKLRKQINSMAVCLDVMRNGIKDHPKRDELLRCIHEWGALMSRTHYSEAKNAKYTELYDVIKEKYNVKRLKKSTAKDGKAYVGNILLGKNFEKIDAMLLGLWESPDTKSVRHDRKDRYADRSVTYLASIGKATPVRTKTADLTIPKKELKWRTRMIHNAYIYRIGQIFFKKGSRMRKFLKKFL